MTTIQDCAIKMLVIAITGAAVALTGACNSASPVESMADDCVDDWDAAYDAGVDDGLSSCVPDIPAECDAKSIEQELDDVRSVLSGVIAERDHYKQKLAQEQSDYMALYYSCQESSDD